MNEEIRQIQRDITLSQVEKDELIKNILKETNQKNILKVELKPCTHYKRNCDIIAICCDKQYPCRVCHNENSDHRIDRFATKECVCRICKTRQDISNTCINCGTTFGKYFCSICKLWTEKNAYHCNGCGICNSGILGVYEHCDKCGFCFPNKVHNCVKKGKDECCVCFDQVYYYVHDFFHFECGHGIHSHCFTQLKDYKCPLCKKSVYNLDWTILDDLIASQPMPEQYIKKVTISCNDCIKKSETDYDFLGNKCQNCKSYNTIQL